MLRINHAQHGTTFAFVFASDHNDVITLLDLAHRSPQSRPTTLELSAHSTSGARDTIFMKRSVRSSLVTGPKIRVPMGSSLGVSSTAALLSNLSSEPSWRLTPRVVRTTTAL